MDLPPTETLQSPVGPLGRREDAYTNTDFKPNNSANIITRDLHFEDLYNNTHYLIIWIRLSLWRRFTLQMNSKHTSHGVDLNNLRHILIQIKDN